MSFVADTWFHFLRLVRITRRMPVFLLMSIIQPILWILLFSQLFRSVANLPGFGGGSYIQFVAPGIAVMSALFGAAYSGMGLLGDMDRGVLDRMLVTPAAEGSIIGGRLAHAGAQVVLQSFLLIVVAILRGARPHGGVLGMVILAVASSLLGAGFAGISCALALLARRQELVIAVMNFILLPMVYLSSMLMTRNLMPAWMSSAAHFNPVNWAVNAARRGFEGEPGVLVPLAALAVFTFLCGGLATAAFRRYRAAS